VYFKSGRVTFFSFFLVEKKMNNFCQPKSKSPEINM
jgi:hypothetical protein